MEQITDTTREAESLLREHWGHDKLKKAQVLVIECAAGQRRDVLAVLPTGFGKSATFQIPALMAEGTAIVVSPLIALMKDQVDDCRKRGIPAGYVNSHLNEEEARLQLAQLSAGEFKLMYVSPERIPNDAFRRALSGISMSFVVVDEAHCVSRWGHDFRPAYSNIRKIFKGMKFANGKRPPIIAVTATATRDIEGDIAESLGMKSDYMRIVGDPIRPNLSYEVSTGNEWGALRRALRGIRDVPGRHVIYTTTRQGAETIIDIARKEIPGVRCGFYHAGMNKVNREAIQEQFKAGETKIICATCAFGMGIDVPDIRTVIHFGIPGSLEDYCQQIGRAGRDGLPSKALLIDSAMGVSVQELFLRTANPSYDYFEWVWNWLNKTLARGEAMKKSAAVIAGEVGTAIGQKLDDKAVGTVLSVLSKMGLVERRPASGEAALRLNMQAFQEAMEKQNPKLRGNMQIVATYLWDEFAHDCSQTELRIRLSPLQLTRKTDLPPKSAKNAIAGLAKKGLLESEPQFTGKSTRLVKPGLALETVLTRKALQEKYARDEARLDTIKRYPKARDKVAYIRDYFLGEKARG